MALKLRTHVAIPRYEKEGGEFDHGDVEWKSGDLFIAHPSKDTIELVRTGGGWRISSLAKPSQPTSRP